MLKISKDIVMLAVLTLSISAINGQDKDNLIEDDGIMIIPENEINPPIVAGRVVAAPLTTGYLSVSAEAFLPGSNVAYSNTYGMGGAYIKSEISGALVAHVHLPQNAVITEFRVYFNDNSSKDLNVRLMKLNFINGGYTVVGTVTSSGITGYGNRAVSLNSTVSNLSAGYLIYAWCSPWDASGNLKIMGARIRYTY
ncbi:MAG: hypothetical protein JW915_10285 [Chitinispirillaceae bacterium]|nr:hypothetical protein [Chitinispirillaceae bacterium]